MGTRFRHGRPRAITHGVGFVVLSILICLIGVLSVSAVSAYGLLQSWTEDLPDYTDVDAFALATPSKLYSSDGVLLAEFAFENREPTTIDKVSDYVLRATIDTEDVRFYEHGGIDPQGILRAIVSQLTGGSEGASTITQQLVRNTLLLDEMNDYTIKRKVREAYLADQIEKIYTKDEILMMYLNTINYGDGAYGIEAAAKHYFSKNADELTLAEAALLVGIPQSPTNLNPVYHEDAAKARRNTVLDRMLAAGDISQEDHDAAQAEDIVLDLSEDPDDGIYAYPYFVTYVQSLLSENFSDAEIFKGGLTIYTTLDTELQTLAEDACNAALEGQDDDLEYSLTSIDPSNGHILAMVGGTDYYTNQFNLATQARRQAGSSFKTFTLVTAIDQGVSPEMTIDSSSPTTIGKWTVSNSEGTGYGQMTIRRATILSVNTVYAHLAHEIGPQSIVDMAHAMGITSDLSAVDSIALGTSGVCTMEMADAYATLANGGIHHDVTAITQIENSAGEVIYEESDESTEAVRPEVAEVVTEVLEQVITSGTGYRARLDNGQVAAGKTGTSENNRDNWFVGYTPQLSTAIWLGSREEASIEYNGVSGYGGSTCAPVWKTFTTNALESLGAEIEDFPTSDVEIEYDYETWDSVFGVDYDDDDDYDSDTSDTSGDDDDYDSDTSDTSGDDDDDTGVDADEEEDIGDEPQPG